MMTYAEKKEAERKIWRASKSSNRGEFLSKRGYSPYAYGREETAANFSTPWRRPEDKKGEEAWLVTTNYDIFNGRHKTSKKYIEDPGLEQEFLNQAPEDLDNKIRMGTPPATHKRIVCYEEYPHSEWKSASWGCDQENTRSACMQTWEADWFGGVFGGNGYSSY